MDNMGGNDCPPCLVWRGLELPKLRAHPDFKDVQFIHVEKAVMSAVPPRFFLPAEAIPYKAKLDAASGGMSGSPQVAVLVNGEVYDYFLGTKSAEEVLLMIRSIQTDTPYPFERCIQRRDSRHCVVKGN